jgi:hypothetical protein
MNPKSCVGQEPESKLKRVTLIIQLARYLMDDEFSKVYVYGRAIGKNLKSGNEIENSYRIEKKARIAAIIGLFVY